MLRAGGGRRMTPHGSSDRGHRHPARAGRHRPRRIRHSPRPPAGRRRPAYTAGVTPDPALPPPPEPNPLATGNRLQRAYWRWAAPRYACMDTPTRAEVERIDRFLYSRRGVGFWLGLLGAVAGSTGGLIGAGFPWLLALAGSLMVWIGLPMGVLGAWLQPHLFTWKRIVRKAALVTLAGYFGALLGFLVGRVVRHGGLKLDTLGSALWEAAVKATPLLLVAVLAVLTVLAGMASWRRALLQRALQDSQAREQALQREQERLRLLQERDLAARQAAEARLRLLQAQIQPHFIFNTLAALQHWVDTADPRAGPLLRALSGFLRQSVTLLERPEVPLDDELRLVRTYGEIMQARLGARLALALDVQPGLQGLKLPPGLLLTLVENAIEHGLAPTLSGGTVRVEVRREGTAQVLRVIDDGAGLGDEPAVFGVGLRNSHERLATMYGAHAQLAVQGRPEGGTCAEVRIDDPAPEAAA